MKVAFATTWLIMILGPLGMVNGQDLDRALSRVQSAFGPEYRFKVDREDRLVIDLLKQGRPVRQDVVYIEFLDSTAVRWSEQERAVEMACAEAHGQCIDKEIFHLGTVRHTGRSTLPLPEGRPTDEAVVAMRGLIVAGQARVAGKGLETHRRPDRRK